MDITDQLSSNLDWNTVELTEIGFGNTTITIPPGSQYFQTVVPMTYQGLTFNVAIEFSINTQTGLLSASFQTIDPRTNLPPDALVGFLPPEDGTGIGMGQLSYTVQPLAGLPTGTQIRNVAIVTFDQGETIATDQVNEDDPTQGVDPTKQDLITIDAGPPTSSVNPLPAVTTSPFVPVGWSGTDDPGGSGIASYTVYVSTDGGPFTPWLAGTTLTEAIYQGQSGDTYAFYSVATDNVGNVQPTPTVAQATVQILAPMTVTSIDSVSPDPRNTSVPTLNITFSLPIDTSSLAPGAIALTDNGQSVSTSGASLSLVSGTTYQITGLAGLTSAEGNYTLTVYAAGIQDQYENPGTGSVSISWLMDTTPPTSTVNPLPAISTSTSFTVSVSGSDPSGSNGSSPSGVAAYAIYDSEDNGPFTFWTTVTPTNPSATFTGQFGHTYGFYSVATDLAGNVQPTPAEAQQTVQLINALSVSSLTAVSPNPRNSSVSSINVTFSEPINTGSLSPAP